MILNKDLLRKFIAPHLSHFQALAMLLLLCPLTYAQDTIPEIDKRTEKKERRKAKKDSIRAAQAEYFDETFIDYTTKIYDENVKTLILHTTASELEPPIVNLNGTERLILRFDDLANDLRDLYYSFEHCTYDWKSSDLLELDYMEGYTSDLITGYDFSFNTVQPYIHYELTFPNNRINLKRSGNYIIKVFENDNPDEIVLTARFMVVEPIADIKMSTLPTRIVSERDYRQDIDLEVNLKNLETLNPYSEMELVVLQNFRWDNAIWNMKPSFIKDNILIYDYQGKLSFDGTNEFRMFDAKSARYRSDKIQNVDLLSDGYHVYLSPDQPRGFMNYSFEPDINGRFLVKNDDMENPHLESDYFTIHFTVPVDAPYGTGDMYIFGQISNWNLSKSFRLAYNSDDLTYERAIKLKQGLYNYQYLWRPKNERAGITDRTEGNHSEAENEYMVLVYFKDKSNFSDRLVGFKLDSNYKD